MASTKHHTIPKEDEHISKKKKMESTDMSLESTSPLAGPHPTSDRFFRLLLATKVDIVRPPENKIFVAQRTDLIIEVWKGLVKHNFLSVPVLQKTKSKWYGFVDMYDIVRFVVESFGASEELKNSEDWMALASSSEDFKQKTVNDIMKYPISRRNPFHPINSGYTLFSAIEALAREKGLHRVPIVDENRNLITVISQSQIVNILLRNLDILGEKKDKPVNQMDRYYEEVVSIHQDGLAIDAFKTLVEKNITGLAVVDNDGKLKENISMKDLKAMSTDTRLFWRLYQTVHNFLLKVRKETHGDRPHTIVTVKPDDTLETVIKKLAEHKIHRVYIVDEQKKPVGVISLKDVLHEIIF